MTVTGPLYAQITDALRSRLTAGTWMPGDQLPSEQVLCDEFGVSSITMRRAMATLVAEGKLVRKQGRGTFVADPHRLVLGPPHLSSFSADLAKRGWSSSARVVRLETLTNADTASRLGLKPTAALTVLQRVRLADEVPIAIQTAWLPAHLFPGIEQVQTFDHESLYAVMRRDHGITPADAVETFTASHVGSDEGQLLDVPANTPAFHVERLTTDNLGRSIELVESIIRGDRYTLVFNLRQQQL